MVTAIAGDGTPESVWQAWAALHSWPELELDPAPARAVVVAPHPDDEVLGVGGLLSCLASAGCPVEIVAVTDGEASHPASPTLSPTELAERRAAERIAALQRLGLGNATVHRLHAPDSAVAQWETGLAAQLKERLRPGDWCLATWRFDGHPDHESVGRAALAAARAAGALLLSYPVWTWHWADPGDARVPWHRARRVPLPVDTLIAKRAAAAVFATQVRPLSTHPADAAILPPPVLARLLRSTETVFAELVVAE